MEWMVETSLSFAQPQERSELVQRIASLAHQLPDAEGAAVLLPGPDRTIQLVATAGWPGELPERFAIAENPILIEVMRSPQSLGATHPSTAALARDLGLTRIGVASLFGSTRCVGIVFLTRRQDSERLDTFTHGLVRTLVVQAGLAIERVQNDDQLRDACLHDELTCLGNRRKANLRLEKLQPGDALVLVDLDHLKRIHDLHGHAVGDDVLRETSEFLRSSLREEDEAFRIGGEEFQVVLQQANEGAL